MVAHIVARFIDIPEYLCAFSLKVRLQYCLTEQRRKIIPMVRAKNMIKRGTCAAMSCKASEG